MQFFGTTRDRAVQGNRDADRNLANGAPALCRRSGGSMALRGETSGEVEPHGLEHMNDSLLIEDRFWIVNPLA